MDSATKKDLIVQILHESYKSKGFITEDEALDLLSANDATPVEIDTLLEKLLSMGVIFVNENKDDDEEIIDRAQIDYEYLYGEIIRISPSLQPLVQYVRNTMPPQIREWQNLIKQSQNGNAYAFNRLFDMYLRFVLRIAYQNYSEGNIELDDAIQAGAIGLMHGLKRYDITRNGGLVSYVSWWIKQRIDRAIVNTGRVIRVPVHVYKNLRKLEKKNKELTEEYGCMPTEDELADSLGLSKDEVLSLWPHCLEPLSYDDINDQAVDKVLLDQNNYTESIPLIDEDSNSLLKRKINKMLEQLTTRERHIIRLRNGFDDRKKMTLEEIGKMYNVTRERIRQIEYKAMNKLREMAVNESFI